MKFLKNSFLILLFFLKISEAAKILGIFPIAATSHQNLAGSLMRGLANAGHDVTMVGPFENQVPVKNGTFRQIILTGFKEEFQVLLEKNNIFKEKDMNIFSQIYAKLTGVQPLAYGTLKNSNFQKLLHDPNESFDVIIVEYFHNDILSYIGYHYKAPLIYFSTTGNPVWLNPFVGNPTPVAYLPHILSEFPKEMNFFQRLINALIFLYEKWIKAYKIRPSQNEVLHELFPDAPCLEELYQNVSLVLLNSHVSLNPPFPVTPNMVEIGGFHITAPKKLPEDLQKILDGAKNGVIYFSLGSNAKSKNLPLEKRDALLKAFGKLKQLVLWKWEDDSLPGKPSNVVVRKWMPQNDILAHPNLRLFVTHGGQLSTTETIYHGVPALTIPIFGDQYFNARQAELNGYSLTLPYLDSNFTEERLSSLIEELLNNPKYRDAAKRKSKIFHDRPLKPLENAVFWVEYVIRHAGADHLKVGGAKMAFHKYFLIDIVAFLAGCLIVLVVIFYFIVKKLFGSKKTRKLKIT